MCMGTKCTFGVNPNMNSATHKPTLTFPVVDETFIATQVPEAIVQEIQAQLLPQEKVFGLFRLNTPHHFTVDHGKIEKAPLWVVLTGTRFLLLALSADGELYNMVFDQQTRITYQEGLTRDEITIGEITLYIGPWDQKRHLLKETVNLFASPVYEKYLSLALRGLKTEDYDRAILLLQASLDAEPTIKGYVLLAYAFSRSDMHKQILQALQQACQLSQPDLVQEELQRLFPENVPMLLYLAVVCETNQWWDTSVTIYHKLLEKNPDFDLYYLKLGEIANARQEYQSAIADYQKFLHLRTAVNLSEASTFIHWDLDDPANFSADPDVARAYLDLGVMYATLVPDLEQAGEMLLALLRHAPYQIEAYRRLWHLHQRLLAQSDTPFLSQHLDLTMFLQVYKLLAPQDYAATVGAADGLKDEPARLPEAYRPLSDADHAAVIHPGEQQSWRRMQSWLATLVASGEDTRAIKQYCELVTPQDYPKLSDVIDRLAAFLKIDCPQGFISRGKFGVSVRDQERPFIFMGSEHLNVNNPHYLAPGELVFVIAAHAEHIKSGHVLMTETELWKSVGAASFDGFLVALHCLPAGSFLSRLTRSFAIEGLKKVYKMTKSAGFQTLFKFLEKKPADGDDKESGDDPDRDAAMQQITDFARHAVYTADRLGLLACQELESACTAIFKLTSDTAQEVDTLRQEGLLRLLQQQDQQGKYLYFEHARRFSELIKFACSREYHRLAAKVQIGRQD